MQLNTLERQFINTCQGNFPLIKNPFRQLAKQLGCDQDELIETVNKLKIRRYLTRFGPLYNADHLGGNLTLAAISVPSDRYTMVTELVNAYPQVAHNYRREHTLNMWFVLATQTAVEITTILTEIEQKTGLKVYNFPKQHEFYIGLWLHLSSSGCASTIKIDSKPVTNDSPPPSVYRINEIDKKLIRATQTGLPIEPTPYCRIAENIGLTETMVIQRLKQMLSCGIIRRIGAVPNHYKLGLSANGMTVWNVNDDKLMEMGKITGKLTFVSHCYQRPKHLPMWPYNLFAMVHGHNKDEVMAKTQQIKTLLGSHCQSSDILFSSAILKKTGMRLAA